jgi:hypothetical protein
MREVGMKRWLRRVRLGTQVSACGVFAENDLAFSTIDLADLARAVA